MPTNLPIKRVDEDDEVYRTVGEKFKAIIDERLKVAEASGVPAAQYYAKEILGKGEKAFVSKVDKP